MFARIGPRIGPWLPAAGAAVAGAIYGLGLARFIFELSSARLGLLRAWPGALLLAALAAAVALAVSLYARRLDRANLRYAPWAPVALALPLFGLTSPDVNLLRSVTLLLGGLALATLFFFSPARVPATPTDDAGNLFSGLIPVGLFLCLFSLYLRTLAPAVGQADTFEFQVDVARLGIAHGSGYPLLMLLGRLFTLLPVGGTLAFRANLTSAFFGALAGVGVERVSRRLGAAPLVAGLAGLAFGVSPTLWSRAVEIEVFALNAAFVAAVLYVCCDLILPSPRPSPSAPSSRSLMPTPSRPSIVRLALLAFLFGLSLTNHLTTLFLGPACLVAGFVALRRQSHSVQPNSLLWGSSCVLFFFLLGLSVYLYVPIRWPAVNHGQALSLAGFVNILTGNEAKGAFNWRLPLTDSSRYAIVWSKFAGEYGWPGLVLAFLGIISLLLTDYIVVAILLITSAGYFYFALAFNVPDPSFSSYLIPLHLIAAVLMALGVQALLNLFARWPQAWLRVAPAWGTLTHVLLLSAFSLLPLNSIWRAFHQVDRSGDWAAQRLGELMLSQPLAQGAAILADSEKIAPLDYLQIADGRRPDLDITVLPDEASYRAALDQRLAAGQVVYLGRYLPDLASAYFLRSIGPLAEVSTQPLTSTGLALQPALAQPVAAGVDLAGYAPSGAATSLSAHAGDELDLTLVWRAQAVPASNLLVNLRLVDAAGQSGWQSAGSVPVDGLYPTNAWRAGDVITDFYRLPVDLSLPPGQYQLQVALMPPFAAAPATAWAAVAPVAILPPTQNPTPPHAIRAEFGADWLVGYDLPEAVAPGSQFALTLFWLRPAQSTSITALGETRSLAAWPHGAVVPIVYRRTAPATGNLFQIDVATGALAQCGWLWPASNGCYLPAVRLAGQAAADGAINFDNLILLNRAMLETPRVAPGGRVSVHLEWQALRTLTDDYTVFVHLLGPDGLVHGQIDSWPVSGTRATSGWAPGETIADPYAVLVAPDAPPGSYSVEIGLYLLASGQRVPVLNAAGTPVDDRVLLTGLEVDRN